MNATTLPPVNDTPLCYSIRSTPFKFPSNSHSCYYSLIFSILGLSSNLIALIVLFKSFKQTPSQSRSAFLIFLGGLVVTDFMGLLVTGSIVMSFYVTHFDWRKLDPNCHFCNFMGMSMVFYGLCPLLLGAAMAVERFIGINHPFVRYNSMPQRQKLSMVLMVWLIAGTIALLPLTGLGSYHIQFPGSWCFFNISSKGKDQVFSLLFSLTGLMSIAVSFLLNTVSFVTLIKVCCGQQRNQRRRDHEVEMMIQLLFIMVIASICWCPLLVYIAQIVLSGSPLEFSHLLLWLRLATCNQILDPWVYILFRRAVLKRIYPCLNLSRSPSLHSSISLYQTTSVPSHAPQLRVPWTKKQGNKMSL